MIRIGQGVDVHAFEVGRRLVLGGIVVSEELGLGGHSDADAVLHAITDALLGAVAGGDIGDYFPSTDPRWRGAASALFVTEALGVVAERGGRLVNVDVTIIAERPRLAPFRQQMREATATLLEVDVDAVSVKMTTTDGLGFTGRGEGICAVAIVAVEMRGQEKNE